MFNFHSVPIPVNNKACYALAYIPLWSFFIFSYVLNSGRPTFITSY